MTKEEMTKIIYDTVRYWSYKSKFSKHPLKCYDNWKDDLIDTIWQEMEKGNV